MDFNFILEILLIHLNIKNSNRSPCAFHRCLSNPCPMVILGGLPILLVLLLCKITAPEMVDASACVLQFQESPAIPPPTFPTTSHCLNSSKHNSVHKPGFHVASITLLKHPLWDNVFVNVSVAWDDKEKCEVIIKHFLHQRHVSYWENIKEFWTFSGKNRITWNSTSSKSW